MGVLTAEELTALCKLAAEKKTLYVMGCFGAPMTEGNKKRYCFNHPYNAKPERTAKIRAASADRVRRCRAQARRMLRRAR